MIFAENARILHDNWPKNIVSRFLGEGRGGRAGGTCPSPSPHLCCNALLPTPSQGRRHGVDWGGHVHPTFARGRS